MEIELGLKITHTRDDATSSTEFRFAKDGNGPLFFSRETTTMFILIAYLRGFKRENIEIKISEDGKQLTIGGKKPVHDITLRGWIMHKKDEIREFKKIFLIPDGVNLNRTKAKFNNDESTLRITMPKLVKGICGIEIQEVTEEHKERHEAEVSVDDLAYGKECEAEISEVAANQSLLKEGKTFDEGAEARIERKEKINDVAEKAVDAMPLEKDSQVEQGGVRGCESMTPTMGDNSSLTDDTPIENVESTIISKKEKTDHVADQALDAFQGDEHYKSEQDEFQGDKQDQVEQKFGELQSDKHDQVNQRDVSRNEPKAPPVVTDETSHKGGKSVKEDAESVMENKMDQMVEQQHEEADQQSDVSRCELEIPQVMIGETTKKEAKLPEKDAESKMPSKLDQSVDEPQRNKADEEQLSEISRYEPKMSQVKIDEDIERDIGENIERDIGEAEPDSVKKKHLGELEIPEATIDETQKNDGKPLERSLGNMIERKEDQIEKHLNGENQPDKFDHSEKMEVRSNEPEVPQVMVGVASEKIENLQEDGAEFMTESKEKKRNQSAEQVVDEQQYEKSSQKDSSLMEDVEAPMMRTQEKTDHVVDQAFAEIQGNEFPDEKRDQVGPSFDKFQSDEQSKMNQRDVSCGEPEASLVVTDEISQELKKSLEEDAESMMERKKDQFVDSQHDEADEEQQREVSRCELEIPQAMIEETAQKNVKSREEDADSMMPSKVDQMVDKLQHDETDQVKPRNVSRDKPEIPQATIDETIADDIEEALGDKVDSVPHREVRRHELEMQEDMIDETMQDDDKPLEEGAESMMKIKERIDQVDLVDHAEQSEGIYLEQSEVGRIEPKESEDIVDEIIRKEPDVPEAMVDAASGNEEKSYEDGRELMEERKEKKTDQVAEQVVDAQQHDKADHVEKCKDGKFLEEPAQSMMKSKGKIDWVDEHTDGDEQSDKVDYAKHPEVRKYPGSRAQESDDSKGVHFGEKKICGQDSELERFPAGDALEKDKELEEISELEMESKQEIDRAKENVKVSPETDVSKSILEKIDEEPKKEMKEETQKLADENADKERLKKKIDAADTIPQIIATVEDEEATHKKEEQRAIPAFCPTPGTSKPTASEIHQAMGKRVGEWEPKKTTMAAEEVFEKDDKSVKSGRKDQEESVHVMEHLSGDVQFKKVEAVTGGSHGLDDEGLILEEKLEKSDIDTGKETKGAVEEKVDEKVSNDIGDVPKVAPEVVVSFKLEETTHRKEEPHPHARLDSYPETTEISEAPETQFVSEEVSEWKPRTIETVSEGTPRTYEQLSEEETKSIHTVDERKLKDLAETVEVSPEIDSLKPMVEEKIRDSETEITEATAEKTIEKKAGEREIKEPHGFTGEIPEAIESTKLDGATPRENKLPASTSYSDTKILDHEVSEHDRIGKQDIIVDAALDEAKGSLEETEKRKTDSKEERDHVTGHAADEWQFKKVDVTEVSPPLDSNQIMSEEKFEKSDIGMTEEAEKVMDEMVDEEESRKLQDTTQLADEIPAITFRVEEPPFREVTETSGVKSEKEIGQLQMTEATEQSQREEFLHLKQHEKQVVSASRSSMEEEAQRPKSIGLGNVTDHVTPPEEPNVTESQPMTGKTLSEPEKQEHETSVEGTMRPQPDKVIERVEAPLITVEPQHDVSRGHDKDHRLENEIEFDKKENEMIFEGPMEPKSDQEKEWFETTILADEVPRGREHGKGSETAPERQETEMSSEGHMKPATDLERRQDETSFLADELPQDGDHEKRSETAPERQELGMNFEGHMKPASNQERVQDETPILADDPNNGRDKRKYEDSTQGYECEPDKKESELSTEAPMKNEPDQGKETVETPISEDQPQQHSDHAKDEKQGRRNEKTPEKQEVGMSFEEHIECAAPDKKMQQFDTPLGDKLQNHGEEQKQRSEVEAEKLFPQMFSEGRMEPEPDQKIEQVETTLLADQPVQSGDDTQDEVHALHSEIDSENMEAQVIPEGSMRPETEKEEQVETPVLADKQGKDKGRRKDKFHELGKEIEELQDELQLPEKKETEKLGYPETEMQKDFRNEQTSRKMDTVVPINCKLRSFLLFAGSTFLLPLIVLVIKKSLIEFKSKKR